MLKLYVFFWQPLGSLCIRHVTPVKRKEPEEDDEFGPSWIPMGLKIVRNPDGSVDVTEISDEVKKIAFLAF